MIQPARVSLASRLLERLNLKFPTLFLLFGLLTLIDFIVPDVLPFVDEIGLAMIATLFGMWKKRKS